MTQLPATQLHVLRDVLFQPGGVLPPGKYPENSAFAMPLQFINEIIMFQKWNIIYKQYLNIVA
ncbi:hypothetical protein [Escherichia fergusonii]|uniref:hypothetical protein n=1 Tax=Escherichia fergusonii TaxID=564 RepID=UPI00200C3012|nr:hypothetical protein [Escherichia fergusonii]